MSGCVLAGGVAIALAAGGQFSLEWTHSVEKTAWREIWRVADDRLSLQSSAVKGSGAGMEPAPGGRFEDGWWVAAPPTKLNMPELVLAASGETASGWTICGTACRTIGEHASDAIRIRPCPAPG